MGSRQKEKCKEKMTSQHQELFKYDDEDNGKYVACVQEQKKGSRVGEQDLEFTTAEINLFERRYQEGYDLHHDERYN